jgi:type IV pilus assembly protein PilC
MRLTFDSVFNRVSSKDKAFFIRQLAIMISSGIPFASALNMLSQQTSNDKLKQALRVMTKEVEDGHPFSQAASRYPEIFDPITLAMLRTGEASGQMHTILGELADQNDKALEFMNKVRNALLYPGFVVFVMLVVGIIMTTVIVPRLVLIFEDTDLQLPWTTQLLIGVSSFMLTYWYLIVILCILAGLFIKSYLATPAGRQTWYHFQFSTPVIKDVLLNSYLTRFTSVLAMLIRSGVPFSESLRIVSDSMSNQTWAKVLAVVKQEVERGIPLSAALGRHEMFPKPLTQMVSVGEQTGKLDDVLEKMSQFYEEQTNAAVKAITTLIEPALLIVVALGVGFVVISVIVPIYNIAEQF